MLAQAVLVDTEMTDLLHNVWEKFLFFIFHVSKEKP